MQELPSTNSQTLLVAQRVEQDDSPSLLMFLNVDGFQIALNRSAQLFFATSKIVWESIFVDVDARSWEQKISRSRSEQTPASGYFRIRRLDNAVRKFILRAEPRYEQHGEFCGHLVSALDITEVCSERGSSEQTQALTSSAAAFRKLAQSWHDELVSAATVITISDDLLPEVASREAADALNELLDRISRACASIRANVDAMNAAARNQRNIPVSQVSD